MDQHPALQDRISSTSNAIASTSRQLPPPPLFDFINDDYGGGDDQIPIASTDDESAKEEAPIRTIKKIQPRRSLSENADWAARVLSPIVRKERRKRGADYDETWTLEADEMESDPEVYLAKLADGTGTRAAQLERGKLERGSRAAKRARLSGKKWEAANYSSSDEDSAEKAKRARRLPSKTPLQLAPTGPPPQPITKSKSGKSNPTAGRLVPLEVATFSQLTPNTRAYYEKPRRPTIKLVKPKTKSARRFLENIDEAAFRTGVPRKAVEKKGRSVVTQVLGDQTRANVFENDCTISTVKKGASAKGASVGMRAYPELDLAPLSQFNSVVVSYVLSLSYFARTSLISLLWLLLSHSVNPQAKTVQPRPKASAIKKRVVPPSKKKRSNMYGFHDTPPAVNLVAPTIHTSPLDDHPIETPSRLPFAKISRQNTNISNITPTPPHSPRPNHYASSSPAISRISNDSPPRAQSREGSTEIDEDPIRMEQERIGRLPTPVSRFRFGGPSKKRFKPRLSFARKASIVTNDQYFSPPPPNQQYRRSSPESEFGIPHPAMQLVPDSDSGEERIDNLAQISGPPTSILRSNRRPLSRSSTLKRHVSFSSPTHFQPQKSRLPLRSKTLATPNSAGRLSAEKVRSRTVVDQGATLSFLAEREEKRRTGGSGKLLRRLSLVGPALPVVDPEEEVVIVDAEEQVDVHLSSHEYDDDDNDPSPSVSPPRLIHRKNRHITISPSPLPFPPANQTAQSIADEFDLNLSLSPYVPTPSLPSPFLTIHKQAIGVKEKVGVESATLGRMLDNPNEILSLPPSFRAHAGSGEVKIIKRSATVGGARAGAEWI